uniref:Large ribosomal subunit protein P2 n=1 Tax=Cyprinus carpio carpio TaxID=630221 RepID=A0A9J7ZX76_CYPCA
MRYVAAYLLAALGGKESPSTGDIKKILDSVGIEADDTRMSKVVSELNGKNLEEVIAQGFSKLASVPSGGAVAASSAAAPSAGGSAAAPAGQRKKRRKRSLKNPKMTWDSDSLTNLSPRDQNKVYYKMISASLVISECSYGPYNVE